jgi:hypothetical protein
MFKTNNWRLWHYSLENLGEQNMKKLKSEENVINEKLTNEFCKDCALGKSKKLPHQTVENPSDLIIIHSDLAGPMKTESIGRKRYMLTYICNQTEYSFVYFLSTKDEQFEKFKQFKSLYEERTNKKIQGLHTDNGSIYISTEFSEYLKDNGIVHYTAVAYCPQSNSKAERLNQILIEKARCMIIAAKVNYNLWTTAIDTANYIRNRSPTSSLNGKTPFELFFNKIPSH